MPKPLQLEVVTPERLLVREEVESVQAPGEAWESCPATLRSWA